MAGLARKKEGTTLLQHLEAVWKFQPMLMPSHAMICHAVPCTRESPTTARLGSNKAVHCCPSREVNNQIRHTKYPRHSDFPSWSRSLARLPRSAPSLPLACGGERSASGNMISSMIQRLAKSAPSHSHGDDMARQSTAHVFFFRYYCCIRGRLLRTQDIEYMHAPGQTTVYDAQSFPTCLQVRFHVAAVRGAQKATIMAS